jgi:hypothetical protein
LQAADRCTPAGATKIKSRVAAALIGTYFHAEVAAFVTRYAGQQVIFGGGTKAIPPASRNRGGLIGRSA